MLSLSQDREILMQGCVIKTPADGVLRSQCAHFPEHVV